MLKKNYRIGKLYYTIGEVAQLFEVNPSLIRFWEKEFDVLRPCKNKKGNRLFTMDDLDTLRIIYHLVKEKGYTLQGARDKIRSERHEVEKNIEVIESLQNIRAFLLELRQELDE